MRAYALQMMITSVHDRMMCREVIFWRDAKRVCDAIFNFNIKNPKTEKQNNKRTQYQQPTDEQLQRHERRQTTVIMTP